ncbi:hypothetical protein [Nocardia sp. NPDC049707]|uniref:hypothetical protein n=1 Tax=Nocardia sp. NPDC049707 TaxID=3154735 RepID=UPI00342F49F5
MLIYQRHAAQHPIRLFLDAVLAVEEQLDVLLSAEHAAKIAGPDGIRLDAWPGWTGSASRGPGAPPGTTS